MKFATCDLRFAICIAIFLCGCEKKVEQAPPVSFEAVRGHAVISGQVKLDGAAPVMRVIDNVPCHPGAPKLTDETVVVGAKGGLANAFVYVQGPVNGVAEVDGSTQPPALLDQKDCRYLPHVVGVCVGQSLRIRSSDDAMHNVHYSPQKNKAANFGMQAVGDERTVRFESPEFIRVQCDVHPWMSAQIGVFANPFFAVTDGDGQFEIRDLPAGKYKLAVWHERYGELKRDVDVSGKLNEDFEYKAP